MLKKAIVLLITLSSIIAFSWFLFHKNQTVQVIVPEEKTPLLSQPPIEPQKELPASDPAQGFFSLSEEISARCLHVQGTIPHWLNGFLIRTGPGFFDLSGQTFKYWFDGFALLQSLHFAQGAITYSAKFLKSDYYKHIMKSGKIPPQGEKKPSFFSKMGALLSKRDPYDNGNMNIMCLGKDLVAITESTLPVAFDLLSLETKGIVDFDDDVDGHVMTPHPLVDPETGYSYNVLTHYGQTTYYHVYSIRPGSTKRTILCSVEAKNPSYIHGISVTENFVILTLTPFVVNPPDLLFSVKPFLDYFSWRPELGSSFVIIDKKTGRIIETIKTEPFFVLNQINSFQKNNQIYLDMITYPDASIMRATTMENLRNNPRSFGLGSELTRFNIDLKTKTVHRQSLGINNIELPRINSMRKTLPYRYIYAMGSGFSSIEKIDIEHNQHLTWQAPGCCPTEPIFIPHPHAKKEDDGVLVTQVLDTINEYSFILILDAHNLHEIARAKLPALIPFGLHGIYCPC